MKSLIKDIVGTLFVVACIAGPVALNWFGPLGH